MGRRGFTLIELVVIIAVVAILAVLIIPSIIGDVPRAQLGRARSDTAELGKSIDRMRADTGVSNSACLTDFTNLTLLAPSAPCTPPNAPGGILPLCVDATVGYICWDGPYIVSVSTDPWNNAYVASEDTTTFVVTVESFGPDGISGDSDDITSVE